MANQLQGNWFDRFAERAAGHVARPWFFSVCVLLILLWAPTFLVLNVDTWQLVINTATTIITFLLVALLHNDQQRFEAMVAGRLDDIDSALGERDG